MAPLTILPFLQSVPKGTRILTLLLIVCSAAHAYLRAMARQNSPVGDRAALLPWLVLVPGEAVWYPWTLLSSGFVEIGSVEFLVSLVALPLASRYFEKLWGAKELFRFSAIVIVASNTIAFGLSWIEWFVLGNEDFFLYGIPYHGLSALLVGFLVAFTQLIPEHQVQVLGMLKIRVKSLPGIYLLVSNVLTVVFGPSPYILIQFGFFVSWVYLRFFKLSENGEFRGDRSETFAFIYWFPTFLRPYIGIGANFVFNLAVRLKVVKPWDEASAGSYAMLPGPGGARAEAERRRALALKALDARMAAAPSPAPPVASTSSQGPSAPTDATDIEAVKPKGDEKAA